MHPVQKLVKLLTETFLEEKGTEPTLGTWALASFLMHNCLKTGRNGEGENMKMYRHLRDMDTFAPMPAVSSWRGQLMCLN